MKLKTSIRSVALSGNCGTVLLCGWQLNGARVVHVLASEPFLCPPYFGTELFLVIFFFFNSFNFYTRKCRNYYAYQEVVCEFWVKIHLGKHHHLVEFCFLTCTNHQCFLGNLGSEMRPADALRFSSGLLVYFDAALSFPALTLWRRFQSHA